MNEHGVASCIVLLFFLLLEKHVKEMITLGFWKLVRSHRLHSYSYCALRHLFERTSSPSFSIYHVLGQLSSYVVISSYHWAHWFLFVTPLFPISWFSGSLKVSILVMWSIHHLLTINLVSFISSSLVCWWRSNLLTFSHLRWY